MATNKNALIRYRTIDRCLQNRSRKWTLTNLIDACSDALYEYEGKDVMVSKRTVQLDIQTMRSNKLGYNAPIVVVGKKYYTYSDPDYSITRTDISSLDMQVLSESMEVLSQYKEFALFGELHGVIQKLQDQIYHRLDNRVPIVHIDKVDDLEGIQYLEPLYQAVRKKIALDLTYQPFSTGRSSEFIFHPYILKEYNNRWFVVGKKDTKDRIITLAIDRIKKVTPNLKVDYVREDFDPKEYYKNTYGITVLGPKQLKLITLKIGPLSAPYIKTKPIHHSQKIIEENENGSMTISLYVHHNYELERLILGFGDDVEVLEPKELRDAIITKLSKALHIYQS